MLSAAVDSTIACGPAVAGDASTVVGGEGRASDCGGAASGDSVLPAQAAAKAVTHTTHTAAEVRRIVGMVVAGRDPGWDIVTPMSDDETAGMNSFHLTDRVALVTGGSRGL